MNGLRRARRWPRGIAALGIAVAACAADPVTTGRPKAVVAQLMTPYTMTEECVHLAVGDRLDYTFTTTEPVAFNIRYHAGNAVVMPIARDQTTGDAGVFLPKLEHDYCLMWEAGPAGALLDYRIRLRSDGR